MSAGSMISRRAPCMASSAASARRRLRAGRRASCGARRCACRRGPSDPATGVVWRLARRMRAPVAGSAGSKPHMAESRAAASATVRAIGPAVSWLCAIGMMPARLTSPSVGLMPTRPHVVDGRHDRAVGLGADRGGAQAGRGRGARAGARAARVAVERIRVAALPAAPAPAARRVRRAEVGPLAHVRLAEQDRARRRAAAGDGRVRAGIEPTSASEPAVVCIRSAVSMLSFSRIGMPCSGPRRSPPCARRRGSAAIASASGLISST